ncbi:MAG: hypothetical protein HRU80_15405 [Ignavibacteriales bacterium]|nr:MAG: hypothetical protein HRU80_15405 [Ignavibacteriales bacterium]
MSKENIRSNLKNIIGFVSNRKIVVIESDDWGSIRTRSKTDYDRMLSLGLNLNGNPYTKYDSLESNNDLERLYDTLSAVKDKYGNYPVFTPMYIMANPDYKKIKDDDFQNYHYEHFFETCKDYPCHDKVKQLILEGIGSHIFVPALHGREHLNAPRWLRILRSNNEGAIVQFQHRSIGADSFKGVPIPMYLGAFDPELPEDTSFIMQSLVEACKMFENSFGYRPKHFIEPDEFGTKELESKAHELGIRFLLRAKVTKYSNYYNKKTRPYFHWIGKRNKFGQVYLTRNCTFEPHRPLNLSNVVDSCLAEIDSAFKWKKPAVIISHRSSYVGSISEKNQINGLKQLKELLESIVKNWPDVEFMTSMQLGDLINRKND